MYLLDTNIVNRLRNGDDALLNRLVAAPGAVFVSTLVAEEILVSGLGAQINSIRSGKSRADLDQTNRDFARAIESVAGFNLLPYTSDAEAIYKTFKAASLKGMDGRIAAHALALGFVVVTENVRDFAPAPGLTVEDWTA